MALTPFFLTQIIILFLKCTYLSLCFSPLRNKLHQISLMLFFKLVFCRYRCCIQSDLCIVCFELVPTQIVYEQFNEPMNICPKKTYCARVNLLDCRKE